MDFFGALVGEQTGPNLDYMSSTISRGPLLHEGRGGNNSGSFGKGQY